MNIRPERPEEFPAIYKFVKEAFSTARVSDGDEQDFVEGLRAGENYIPELALVGEKDGALVAHIMLTRTFIRDGGNVFEALLLTPVSVLAGERNKGFGSLIIRAALEKAREMGFSAVLLVGHADYYPRFGFKSIAEYQFGHNLPPDVDLKYIMALELRPDSLKGVRGIAEIT